MDSDRDTDRLVHKGAKCIKNAFNLYQSEFKKITQRARQRFETSDWHGAQLDAVERLELYTQIIRVVVADIHGILKDRVRDKAIWEQMKGIYSILISDIPAYEVAETFFNSVTRRIFITVGVDPKIEYVDSDFEEPPAGPGRHLYRSYRRSRLTAKLIAEIIEDYQFEAGFEDLERDARLAAGVVEKHLLDTTGSKRMEAVQFLLPVFYRSKGAYLIGRFLQAGQVYPIVLCLRHLGPGIRIDAVLLTTDEVSILFSFTRSYFHVEVERPQELVAFLKTLMPLKRIAELYISIGFNKHGKTLLYRDLLQHLRQAQDQFEVAPGEKGMVMLVFDLPSFDMVFKVIRDIFAQPKTTTRQDVMERYQLVFKHDRAGRLVDAQEFEYLRFPRSCFTDELLRELLEGAPSSVTVDGDAVAIRHLYIERRLTPLNLYVRQATEQAASEAVVDYGNAIKDMAATNIFPGDILLKNFGVTRHGRVVFYDYDELTLLTNCKFRHFPQARDYSADFEAEPWFYVDKNDIFPQEFNTFLGLQGKLRGVFESVHNDLFQVSYWRGMQKRHEAGEVIDIYPYGQSSRLHKTPFE